MTDRQVKRSRKDLGGDITALCNPGEFWSPRSKDHVISDIESRAHTYTVIWPAGTGKPTPVRVVNGPKGKYLRSDRDDTTKNNLDELPDC